MTLPHLAPFAFFCGPRTFAAGALFFAAATTAFCRGSTLAWHHFDRDCPEDLFLGPASVAVLGDFVPF